MGHIERRPINAVTVLMAAAISLLLFGCAGTARGVKQSTYRHDASVQPVDASRSQADAMVVVRYPAFVDEDAAPAYYRLFARHAIGGRVDSVAQASVAVDRLAQAVLAKSNYFAMSLYRELRDALPPDSVLLSPHLVELGDDGRLTSRPLLASEQIPTVVTIDFSVYTFPDAQKMMDSAPLTFGDIVTPLFVIHANRWLRPSTHGLLLASAPLAGSAWQQSFRQADEQVGSRWQDRLPGYDRPLDFIAFLDQGNAVDVEPPRKSPGESGSDVVAVEIHPLEKIRMDGALLEQQPLALEPDPFAEQFVRGAATRIVAALNRADHDRATFFTRQAALSRFDPELGAAVLSRSDDENLRARLRMGEALIAAERKFLAAQSAGLYEGVYEGLYGDGMREMIAAEYRLLEERRDLARAQNLGTALAILAMAGAIYVGEQLDAGELFQSEIMGQFLLLSSLWATGYATSAHAESRTIGENFLSQMAPAINRQVSIQVEWLQSREEITARDFAEFRDQTLALYQRSVRSVAAGAVPTCAFRHPAFDRAGRWFGSCRGGLGEGDGYGLLLAERDYVVEYVGETRSGLADGGGAMIFRAPGGTGTVFYEGNFRRGLPHGVVRVEQPGRKARARTYRDGQDRGAADWDDLRRVPF
jgi:hypothetical protein